jgi:molybdopterin molybdotransferase
MDMMAAMLSFEEALAQLLAAAVSVSEVEQVASAAARDRVLAADLCSPIDVPPLDNSAMDGYCLRCADLVVAGTTLPVMQRIAAGSIGAALVAGSAARIFTGAPIPPGADAVVMQEQCTVLDGGVRVDHLPEQGDHIRRRGEDIAQGDVVLRAGTRLNAAHLGVAASVGAARLPVRRRLRVALFSTGDELVMPGVPPQQMPPGAIYNSNRTTLQVLLEGLGCEVSDLGIVPDRLDTTRQVLRQAAADHDLILTSGGVSVGEEDHVKPAVDAEGRLTLWKIAIKPGKPLAFGQVRRDPAKVGAGSTAPEVPFIGLPGNPVSSFVTFLILVRPFIAALQGATDTEVPGQTLRAEFNWPTGDKAEPRREFLRVRRNASGGLQLHENQGSGVLTSCAWADGLVDNPPQVFIRQGDAVRYLSFEQLLR